MISLPKLILTTAMLSAGVLWARLPGHMNLTPRGGVSFPGFVSQGSSFIGRSFAFSASYIPFPDANVGLQASLGLEFNAYRHYFEEKIFIEHLNRGISSDICARMGAGKNLYVLVGLNVYLPVYHEVDMGEKNFNNTYYYSTDSLRVRYKPTPLQAAAVIAAEYSMGRKEQAFIGVRLTQAGNSPVKENGTYNDANGNTIVISSRMRPASAQLYFSLRIASGGKRKDKQSERE